MKTGGARGAVLCYDSMWISGVCYSKIPRNRSYDIFFDSKFTVEQCGSPRCS